MKNLFFISLNKEISVTKLQTYLLCFFFVFFLYFGLSDVYRRIAWCDGTLLADWLINYQDGGYKRRGLSGTLTIFLSKTTGIYIGTLVFGFITFLYVCFCTILIFYFRKIRFNFSLLLLFFLPTTLLFPINDLYAFARKEFLFFMLLAFFLLFKRNYNVYSWKFIVFLSSIIILITHLHESVVFYIPYLLILYLIDYKYYSKGSLLKILILGSSAFIPALCIFVFGVNVNMGGSWAIFKQLGVNSHVMDGILSYPIEGFGDDKLNSLTFAKQKHYEYHLLSYLITFLVFYYFIKKNKAINIFRNKLFLIHIALITISLPIFYLTIDWGRWLNIHFVASLLILTSYLPENKFKTINLKTIITECFNIKIFIKLLLLFVLTFCFTMRHVEDGFLFGLNNTFLFIVEFFSIDTIHKIRDFLWIIRQ